MAKITAQRATTSTLPPEQLMAALTAAFASRSWKASTVAPNQIDVRRGSQLELRLIGGMFARISAFPVLAAVRVDPVGTGSSVAITSLDDLGVGIKTGMRKKYTTAVETFADDIVQAIAAAATPV